MELKICRSQRDGGITSKTAIFCLDARVEFTAPERASIDRYKLAGQVIYNSEAQKRLLEKSEAHGDGTLRGELKSLAYAAIAATKLSISIGSLERGQYVECKSLDELLGAEDAVLAACANLKAYLDIAQSFDGGQVVYSFDTGRPEIVAFSPGATELVAPAPSPARRLAAPHPLLSEPSEMVPEEPDEDPVRFWRAIGMTDEMLYGVVFIVGVVIFICVVLAFAPR